MKNNSKLDEDLMHRILVEATYYAKGNTTIKDTAKRFGVSERTLQLDLNERLTTAVAQYILILKESIEGETEYKKIGITNLMIERYKRLPLEVIRAKTKAITKGTCKGGKISKRSTVELISTTKRTK